MSGHEGRIKGKRFRKPMIGNSNLRERWKFLSVDTDDVVEGSTPRLQKGTTTSYQSQGKNRFVKKTQQPSAGYDFDGDGQVDIREMRLGKFLDEMIAKRQRGAEPNGIKALPDSELQQMRQHAGKLLIAKEFIERNQGQLWRYGSIFAEKNEDQSAGFIAEHKKFTKLMAFLESVERKRLMRSSRHVRGVVAHDEPHHGDEPANFQRQTWVESVRKVNNPSTSKFPLPDLQPRPREIHPFQAQDNNSDHDHGHDVLANQYGALDIDGDGVVDDDEMKLNLRLQEATLDDPSIRDRSAKEIRKLQQMAGRRMMARDFVQRNGDKMWHYDSRFKGRAKDDIVDEIASNELFAKEFNKLRAKERVLTLKSSMGVAGCMAQMPLAELPNDPQHATEFRRVRDRSELLMARRELMKPPEQRMAALLARNGTVPGTTPALPFGAVRETRRTATPMNRTRSEGVLMGLPKIYDTPRRLEPTGCFSVTKWKFGDH